MAENFPNLVKEIDIKVKDTQRVPNKMNPKRLTLRYMIIKCQRLKTRRES